MVQREPDSPVRATAREPSEDTPLHRYPDSILAKIHTDAPKYAGDERLPDVEDDDEEGPVARAVAGLQWIPAVAHGGAISGPRLLVVHDAETPLSKGYAVSVAKNWFGTSAAGTSAHYMVDPSNSVQMVHTYAVAYHVGPNANAFTLGYEQAGYSSFTRAQWLSPDGLAQMKRLAALMAEDLKYYGIPVKRANDAEIRRAATDTGFKAGYCYHNDIQRVLHGTTHTDPGVGYPDDKLLATIKAILNPPPPPRPPVEWVPLSGRIPVLKYGMHDPMENGASYVHRVQRLLGIPATGIYDATTVAKVKAENARLLNRTVDGRTVDAAFWKRIYGMV